MTRKEFLVASAAMMATSFAKGAEGKGGSAPTGNGQDARCPGERSRGTRTPTTSTLNPQPAPRNRHPYQGVDWATAHQIRSTTHVHCKTQADLDVILKRNDFLTLSNYYPSAPWWPLSKMTENYYRIHHDFPVMVNGKRVEGPFDWNKVVGQWINGTTVEAETDKPARFTVITGLGVVKSVAKGTSVKWTLEPERGWSGRRAEAHVFARIKAYALDGSGEELFTQPYMLV